LLSGALFRASLFPLLFSPVGPSLERGALRVGKKHNNTPFDECGMRNAEYGMISSLLFRILHSMFRALQFFLNLFHDSRYSLNVKRQKPLETIYIEKEFE
jgi:hypothetical protein